MTLSPKLYMLYLYQGKAVFLWQQAISFKMKKKKTPNHHKELYYTHVVHGPCSPPKPMFENDSGGGEQMTVEWPLCHLLFVVQLLYTIKGICVKNGDLNQHVNAWMQFVTVRVTWIAKCGQTKMHYLIPHPFTVISAEWKQKANCGSTLKRSVVIDPLCLMWTSNYHCSYCWVISSIYFCCRCETFCRYTEFKRQRESVNNLALWSTL